MTAGSPGAVRPRPDGRYTYPRMNQAFTIREYRKSDFSRLWEIDQRCFPAGISYSQPELLFYIRRPRAFTLVAELAARDKGSEKHSGAAGFIVAEAGRAGRCPLGLRAELTAQRDGTWSPELRERRDGALPGNRRTGLGGLVGA